MKALLVGVRIGTYCDLLQCNSVTKIDLNPQQQVHQVLHVKIIIQFQVVIFFMNFSTFTCWIVFIHQVSGKSVEAELVSRSKDRIRLVNLRVYFLLEQLDFRKRTISYLDQMFGFFFTRTFLLKMVEKMLESIQWKNSTSVQNNHKTCVKKNLDFFHSNFRRREKEKNGFFKSIILNQDFHF